MKRILNILPGIIPSIVFSFAIVACSQQTYEDQIQVTQDMLDAAFTAELVDGENNTYQIDANSREYVISDLWDLDDGTGYSSGRESFELFLPDAGEYTIKHKVTAAGGVSKEDSVVVTVETSDPVSGNLVKGGKFASDEDYAEWTIGGTGSTGGTWTFANGKATLTANGWSGRGIYQAIEVTEGQSYQVDMYASSTTGCTDTWFEVYCGYADPATVSGDYSEGGALLQINTWSGSGTSPFAGKLTVVGSSTESGGVFTASQTGTVYLVIRGGGSDMQSGISITNVELRGISE